MTGERETWPPALALRIDAACCRFEERLKSGETPDIEDYLTGFDGPDRDALREELLAVRGQWLARTATVDHGTATPAESSRVEVPVPPRYAVERELGRGGMGVVYQARDLQLKRIVALKVVLGGGHVGDTRLARFRSEAEAVAALSHPNVVQIFDTGEFAGNPYLVLELLPGGTLADRLRGGTLDPGDAARLVETLARGVHAAHARSIVHRDLKPANIMFAADGVPKVTDFGLVKRLDGDSAHTRTGEFMGTPSYMPPKQAAGNAKEVGPAADGYALGAVLYECLTGRPPFRGSTVLETVRQVLTDAPAPPRRLRTDVPPDLEAVCLKALEKEPGHRYPTAKALADDLRNFLSGRPTDRPASAWRRVEAELYAKNVALAEREWAAGRPQNAGPYLDACPAELRGWEWYCLRGLRDRPLTLREHEDVVYGVTFSPDGARLATVSDDQTIRVWDAATGELLRTVSGHADQLYTPRFTPDGLRLVTASQAGVVKVWDLECGNSHELKGHTDVVVGIDVSRDGRFAASASDDKTVRLWDLSTGDEVRVFRGHTDMVNAVAFSPDGRVLASASYDQTVRLWETATGRELHRLCKHSGFVWSVAFSPDGRLLASGGGDAVVRAWDAETGDERLALAGHSGVVWSVAFSPDGSRLASGGWDKTVRLWDPASGQEMVVLRGHADAVNAVAFSPDGSRLASASDDRTVVVWVANREARPERAPGLTLRDHAGPVLAVAVSRDGRFLASAGDDRTARVWDAGSGTVLHTLTGHTALVGGVAFHPLREVIATASADKTVRLWEVPAAKPEGFGRTGVERRVLRGHTDRVYGVAFSPDGSLLATCGWDRTVRVWNPTTGETVRVLSGHTNWVWSVAFSPDGERLVSCSTDRTVRVWDWSAGAELKVLRGHDLKVLCAAFSPDGRSIASAGGDGVVKIWDATTGQERRTLLGHTDRVTGLAFDPSGEWLATAGEDQAVRIWEVATGAAGDVHLGHARRVNAVAFAPGAERLVSASDDGTVRVWDLAKEPGEALPSPTG